MPLLEFLDQLNYYQGSDLHIASGVPAGMRQYGTLMPLSSEILSAEFVSDIVREVIAGDDPVARLEREKNIDFAYQTLTGDGFITRYRGNAFIQKNGPNLVLRRIPSRIPTIEELGLPAATIRKLCEHHQGLILATGPAGCGKTSTVAAMIDLINQDRSCHIITMEDPIEFVHENKRALINQRQIGRDVESFSTALRGALREDPDVIMVGELRDLETVSLAVTAAETGHVVFGTLHTQSAAKTIDRVVDSFPPEQQSQIRTMLAESLRGVLSQQLIPRADGNGRVAAVEILLGTTPVATLIRENRTFQIPYILETSKKLGMRNFDDAIHELYEKKLISREDAAQRSTNKTLYQAKTAFEPTFGRAGVQSEAPTDDGTGG